MEVILLGGLPERPRLGIWRYGCLRHPLVQLDAAVGLAKGTIRVGNTSTTSTTDT